ncbi:MAG: hypothetical protein WDM96_11905 [Lacunisphaera sp.]
MSSTPRTIASIVGPWKDSGIETGLIRRCREAWDKPLESFTNEELATFLRQKIAVAHLVPLAKKRVADHFEDGTEMYDEELTNAIAHAEGRA